MPHLVGAMVVIMVLRVDCELSPCTSFPTHRTLRPAAIVLMSIGFTQVFLGILARIARMVRTQPTTEVVIVTVAHVAYGALTLASSIALAIQIRRNVRLRAGRSCRMRPRRHLNSFPGTHQAAHHRASF